MGGSDPKLCPTTANGGQPSPLGKISRVGVSVTMRFGNKIIEMVKIISSNNPDFTVHLRSKANRVKAMPTDFFLNN